MSLSSMANDPILFEEMKKFLLNHMGSPKCCVEAFVATSGERNGGPTKLYEKFYAMKNAFFTKFWIEEIMPIMEPPAFLRFIDNMEEFDLGPGFCDNLLQYISGYESHREEVLEMQAQRDAGELDEGQDD